MTYSSRCSRGALVGALALLFLVPATAAAQNDDAPPPAGTLVLGPVRITPTLVLKDMGIDNNVKNESVDPKSDFTFTLTPRAAVAFRMRRLRANVDLVTEYVYFQKYKDEAGVNTDTNARIELDLGWLKPYVSARGIDTKARLNPEVDARARHHDTTYGAGIAVSLGPRARFLVDATTNTVAYDPGEAFRGVELQESFNGRRENIDAGMGFELTPLTTLNVLAGRTQERFTLSPERNADTWRLRPSLNFTSDGILTGSAAVGYQRFETVSPTLPDYSGLDALVNVGVTIYSRHQLRLSVVRDVRFSYDQATAYYVDTILGGTWTMAIVGPFDVRATGSRTAMDYRAEGDTDAGRDIVTAYGGGLGYHLTERARIGVDIDRSHRRSSFGGDREYDNNRIFAGLTWGIKQ
jgi:hypothetical protein